MRAGVVNQPKVLSIAGKTARGIMRMTPFEAARAMLVRVFDGGVRARDLSIVFGHAASASAFIQSTCRRWPAESSPRRSDYRLGIAIDPKRQSEDNKFNHGAADGEGRSISVGLGTGPLLPPVAAFVGAVVRLPHGRARER